MDTGRVEAQRHEPFRGGTKRFSARRSRPRSDLSFLWVDTGGHEPALLSSRPTGNGCSPRGGTVFASRQPVKVCVAPPRSALTTITHSGSSAGSCAMAMRSPAKWSSLALCARRGDRRYYPPSAFANPAPRPSAKPSGCTVALGLDIGIQSQTSRPLGSGDNLRQTMARRHTEAGRKYVHFRPDGLMA